MIPEIVAHRGLATQWPENSLEAFEAALEAGADAIELDVHGTSDGVIVVHHDFAVANAGGRAILSMTAAEIQSTELGNGSRIPRLDEVLAQIGQRATIYVEVKARGIELGVARVMRGHSGIAAVHSFDHRIAREISALVPGLPAGILMVGRPIDPLAALEAARARDLWQHVDFIDEELVATVHSSGRRVIAWTANGSDRLSRLAAMGVDALCTDRPDLARPFQL